MDTTQQPQLGYGKPTEATIDQVNIWMRSQPWYHDLLQSWGQDPNNVHLSKQQSQEIIKHAQGQGVVVDEGNMEVDPSGNFNPKGHKLRNTLIVGGLAAATIATMGVAGAFGSAALPSTAIGNGMMAPIAGGTGLAGSAAGSTAATVAGLTAPLASTATAAGSAALPAGLASGTSAAASGVSLGGSGGGLGSTLASRLGNGLGDKATELISKGLAGASQAAASNRGTQAELALDQNSDLEKQLLAREEDKRRAQTQAYNAAQTGDRAATWQPLSRPAGVPGSYQGSSAGSQGAGSELFNQAMARMKAPDLQNPTGMPAYKNLANDPTFQSNLKPGTMENITGYGSWLTPLIGTLLNRK